MQPFAIYGLSLLSITLIPLCSLFLPRLLNHVQASILKFGIYMQVPLIKLTILEIFFIFGYVAVNAILLLPEISTVDLPTGSINMMLINLVPLLFSGRMSPIINCTHISRRTLSLAHGASGIVSVTQALIHGISWLRDGTKEHIISGGIAVVCLLGSLLTTLGFAIPRRFYPFQKLHQVLPVPILGFVMWHVFMTSKPFLSITWVLLYLSATLWMIIQVFRAWNVFYYRGNVKRIEMKGGMVRLTIHTKHDVKARPGYVYIHVPDLGMKHRFRRRPLPITWWEPGKERVNELVFLVPESLFGRYSLGRLRNCSQGLEDGSLRLRATIQGPYYEHLGLGKYETILLTAQGAGIAGVLPLVLSLLERRRQDTQAKAGMSTPNNKLHNDRFRKVDLYWQLTANDQVDSVEDYFHILNDLTFSRLQVWVVYPDQITSSKLPSGPAWIAFNGHYLEETSKAISKQSKRTPGKCIVIACGPTEFNLQIRAIIRRQINVDNIIRFRELDSAAV